MAKVSVGEGRLAHLPALDGLRGLAVAGVLAFHLGLARGGFLGVDLFFVLSGFLITRLLAVDAVRPDASRPASPGATSVWGDLHLARFWSRRARRLLPALFLELVGVSAYAWFLATPEERPRIRADALASLAYVANWRSILAGNDYFGLFQAPSPLMHMWSLAIEEQYYLVWPLLVAAVLAVGQRAGKLLVVLAALLALASLALTLILYDPRLGSARVYMGTDTRAGALLLGSALGALSLGDGGTLRGGSRRALEAAGVASLLGLGAAWLLVDGQEPALYRGGLFACSLAAGVSSLRPPSRRRDRSRASSRYGLSAASASSATGSTSGTGRSSSRSRRSAPASTGRDSSPCGSPSSSPSPGSRTSPWSARFEPGLSGASP